MRVHWLQHVPFEGLGSIQPWLEARSCQISCSRLYAGDALPRPQDFDWLIVMGGPMNVDDVAHYPWLAAEIELIRKTLARDQTVLGICLGAQLMARALNAEVHPQNASEIGWFEVKLTELTAQSPLFADFSPTFPAFHWHGDSFAMPAGAGHMARSVACKNQAFVYGARAVGLQFHLETTSESAAALIEYCADELQPDDYVQSAAQIMSQPERFAELNRLMDALLNRLAQA